MRALVLIILMAALPVASGTLPPVEADYWAEISGLSKTEFLEKFVSNDVCHRDQDHYKACLKAMNSAYRTLIAVGIDRATANRLTSTKEPIDFNAEIDGLDRLGGKVPKPMLFGKMVLNVLLYFDPHTHLAPAGLIRYEVSTAPQILETGMQIEVSGFGLFVRRVYPNTPASVAGMKVNDQIVSIDGEDLGAGASAQNSWWQHGHVINRLQRYEINRRGQFLKVDLRPARTNIPNIDSKILRVGGEKVAWISVRYFTSGVCDKLDHVLNDLKTQKIGKYVIDLRGNVGGVLHEGVCAASLFLGNVKIMDQVDRAPQFPQDYGLEFTAFKKHVEAGVEHDEPTLATEPLIVLQNASTASASEVFSAAIQDYRRGWIVGEKSMGKGSTQVLTTLRNWDGMEIGYTNAENLRSTGVSIQLNGVTPDFKEPFALDGGPGSEEFLHEQDFSPGYFAPQKLVTWRQPRPQEQGRVMVCADGARQAQLDQLRRQVGYEDNQLAYAAAILSCR